MHITFLVTALILSLSGYGLHLVVFVGSLLIHELGHVMGASFMGAEVTSVEVWPFGAVAKIERAWQLSPAAETVVALGGPFNSGLLAFAASLIERTFISRGGISLVSDYPLFDLLIRFNFALFAVNLIPCLPLDGGRFLRSQISLRTGFMEASRRVSAMGLWVGTGMAVIGTSGIVMGKPWFAVAITGLLITWGAIEEKHGAATANILEILTRNERLMQRRAVPVCEILVHEDTRVSEVVTRLRPSKYNMILVAGKKMKILGKVSETRVLEAFYKGAIDQRVRDLVDL